MYHDFIQKMNQTNTGIQLYYPFYHQLPGVFPVPQLIRTQLFYHTHCMVTRDVL